MGPGQGSPQGSMAETAGNGGGWSREKRPACFLGANDEEFGEAVTRLLLGPDVFVAFVFTRVLKQQWERCQGGQEPNEWAPWPVDLWLSHLTDGLYYMSLVTSHLGTLGGWQAGATSG